MGNETDRRERQFADTQALAQVGSWERRLPDARAQWSDELCRIFGQPLGFAPTLEQFVALIDPADRARVVEVLGRATSGEVCDCRFRIVRPGGEVRHVQVRAGGRADGDGGVAYVAGTMQDVTEQHEVEVARREAQELFETAFSHAPIGMALITPDGRWLYAVSASQSGGLYQVDTGGGAVARVPQYADATAVLRVQPAP